MSRKALGRGLEALIPPPPTPAKRETEAAEGTTTKPGAHETTPAAAGPRLVSVDRIRPNPYQPRRVFDEEALGELTASIRQSGLIQPLVVRSDGDGHFELIAGERRFQASRRAGLTEVPVVVRPASRREMLEIAMVENLQREDLNPVEEAEAYQRLATEFGLTQEEIATRVGKSRSAVTNALRLLTLPEEVLDDLSSGTLTAGHARAILALPETKERLRLAGEIKRKGLSVRQVEERSRGKGAAKPTSRKRSHPALEAWEERLRVHYGTQTRIVGGLARGRVEIHYFNEEDLERILELTGVDTGL